MLCCRTQHIIVVGMLHQTFMPTLGSVCHRRDVGDHGCCERYLDQVWNRHAPKTYAYKSVPSKWQACVKYNFVTCTSIKQRECMAYFACFTMTAFVQVLQQKVEVLSNQRVLCILLPFWGGWISSNQVLYRIVHGTYGTWSASVRICAWSCLLSSFMTSCHPCRDLVMYKINVSRNASK